MATQATQGATSLAAKSIKEAAAYPAVKLGTLHPRKLLWRFTDEITLVLSVLLLLTLGRIALSDNSNLGFDNSILARAILADSDSNPSLYYKLLSSTQDTKTVPFLPQALAEDSVEPDNSARSQEYSPLTNIEANGLKAASPDSIEPFRNAQILEYTVQDGDTLSSIAAARGISKNTVKWANSLTTNKVNPGQVLVLPQVDGVLVKTDESTSIAEIAQKYHGDPEVILSFNGLPHPDAFLPGQYLMCPDCRIPDTTPSLASQNGTRLTELPNEAGSTHAFYPGHCTWYVAKKFKVTFGGSARFWIKNAKAAGYEISDSPVVHSAVVTSERAPYGHVAFVEEVNWDKNTILISEMNYKGLYVLSKRELPIHGSGIVGYILPKKD